MLNSIFNTAILCCANIVCQCYAYNEVKFRLNKLNVSYKTGTEKYYCLILTTLAVLYLSLNQLSPIQSIIVIVFYAFLTLMACIDLLSFLLPRLYTVTFIFSGLLYQTWNNNVLSGLFCAMLMFFIMLFVRLYFAYKTERKVSAWEMCYLLQELAYGFQRLRLPVQLYLLPLSAELFSSLLAD